MVSSREVSESIMLCCLIPWDPTSGTCSISGMSFFNFFKPNGLSSITTWNLLGIRTATARADNGSWNIASLRRQRHRGQSPLPIFTANKTIELNDSLPKLIGPRIMIIIRPSASVLISGMGKCAVIVWTKEMPTKKRKT
jgi:hypothetical protein